MLRVGFRVGACERATECLVTHRMRHSRTGSLMQVRRPVSPGMCDGARVALGSSNADHPNSGGGNLCGCQPNYAHLLAAEVAGLHHHRDAKPRNGRRIVPLVDINRVHNPTTRVKTECCPSATRSRPADVTTLDARVWPWIPLRSTDTPVRRFVVLAPVGLAVVAGLGVGVFGTAGALASAVGMRYTVGVAVAAWIPIQPLPSRDFWQSAQYFVGNSSLVGSAQCCSVSDSCGVSVGFAPMC